MPLFSVFKFNCIFVFSLKYEMYCPNIKQSLFDLCTVCLVLFNLIDCIYKCGN